VLELSEGKSTGNPILANILRARAVNLASGGAVVAPWNVSMDVPEEFIDAAFMLLGKAQRYAQTKAEIELIKNRIRAKRN
jgi:hypothetical protein